MFFYQVAPGETVLAFYSAENTTDKPISGISTYNVVPYEAAKYFNKIQCFCFDEQRLNPHEQVGASAQFISFTLVVQSDGNGPVLLHIRRNMHIKRRPPI